MDIIYSVCIYIYIYILHVHNIHVYSDMNCT